MQTNTVHTVKGLRPLYWAMRENKLTTPLSTRPSSLGGKIVESLYDFLGHGCYRVRYGNLLRAALCE